MDIKVTPTKLCGTVSAPSSKSAAHRALICAALADGKGTVRINGFSNDIKATVRCLESLGARIKISGENAEVTPIDVLPESAVLDCGESGTTLRFLLPVAAVFGVSTEFMGHGRLAERPVEALINELENHGMKFGGGFPVKMNGRLTGGKFRISGNISSQYASGILLALTVCGGELEITEPIVSAPYIELTVDTMRKFGADIEKDKNIYRIKKQKFAPTDYETEGDWTNGAALIACGAQVKNLRKNSVQGDSNFLKILESFGAETTEKNGAFSADIRSLLAAKIDAQNTPDLVPIIAVFASAAKGTTEIKNISRLKYKESNRIESTVRMINSLGGSASSDGDTIVINGTENLSGGTVDSFNDHRIVMAAAAAARFCKNKVIIKNAEAVNKSFPEFFEVYNSLGGAADVV